MSAVVADARKWAVQMVKTETRGSGDLERAMETVARRCDVTVSLIRSLHYRAPKDIWATCYFKIASAYRVECERQAKLLEHELQITAAKVGSSASLVGAARALVGKDFQPQG